MERKIGEIFEFKGKTYEVVKDFTFSCRNCDFQKFCSPTKHISQEYQAPVECANTKRSDKENVIFKEIKKDMEIKDNKLTINIPEGMEIDLRNSNFDTGVIKFKKKELTYKDIRNTILSVKEFTGISVYKDDRDKLFAISQLMNIARFYNKDWEPDWNNIEECKYNIICNSKSETYAIDFNRFYINNNIYFKNKEDAQAVIDNPHFRGILDAIFKN